MSAPQFTLFDTAVGRCGIVWGERGVLGFLLPEGREDQTRARLMKRLPDAQQATPPAAVQRTIDDVVALLRGQPRDLSEVALDMSGVPAFHQRVYAVARTIQPGSTLTYGEIAAQLGDRGAARAVGQALGRNPFPIIVPCHRVLAAGGKVGGFSANGGITTKLRLLTIEGAHRNERDLFEGDGVYGFDPAVAVEHLKKSDPPFARTIDRIGKYDLELKSTPSIFVALAESIVYQQLNGRAAATIFARLRALFPNAHHGPTPEQILRASDERLRGAGLSQAKMLSLRDLAQRAVIGEIPTLAEAHAMDDAALIDRLTHVRGIGRWTVEMLLMFRLGRPDVLPADDFGIRKGFSVAFRKREMPTPKEVLARGAKWAPYRTVASWYLWRAPEG
ncbi:MAG TPA: methylated-DNA--[protein]-cysteine S-methyltransferase [Pseudomonadales bacterium]|nr:methylated-DNA--[protein]-cysteine S-methyltransferase [Pseudomonadales bacterium]